ncbi:MAG: LysM peptidoglycan-binding domain-containing protein [Acidimicrobiales bacterium]|nr:LysM peptidoglycan-binding domain-containing protein [Acidimicrobiales bacterium]MBO0894432.1 LysM peptidoglycan-binding domain-containing protein [Acidimicrobiales bacterium]
MPATYVVQAGDSVISVGQRFGLPWYAVAEENRLATPYLLTIGQVLTIPPAGFQATPLPLPQPPSPPSAPGPTDSSSSATTTSGATSDASSATSPTSSSSSAASSGSSPMAASSSFEACVAFRESTDGQGSSNIYGILPSTWTANGFPGSPDTASPAEQQVAFETIYSREGAAPWAPYDGC